MTDVLATLDDSNPLEFWQKAIAAVPELENSAVAALARYVYIVINNGVLKICIPYCWVATFVVPKGISYVSIIKALHYCPPLPPNGMTTMSIGPDHFTTIQICDMQWHLIYTACEGDPHLPLSQGTYAGPWKRYDRK